MLEVNSVVKTFNGIPVLKGVNLTLNRGDVYGLVGKNGAGKTTLMNIIVSILKKDSGSVVLDGKEILSAKDVHKKIGYAIDVPALFDFMTCAEYLRYLSSCTDYTKKETEERIDYLLNLVGLTPFKDKRLKNYSRGMRQRAGIACTLFANPDIIMFDEPTSALDPMGRAEVMEILKKLSQEGKTILLSTHILSDVEKVCNKIGILENGVIAFEGDINEVLKCATTSYTLSLTDKSNNEKILFNLENIEFIDNAYIKGENVVVSLNGGDDNSKIKLLQLLAKLNVAFDNVSLNKESIEEVFLQKLKSQKEKN